VHYAQLKLADFVELVADRTPAPASGSALAVAAALAAALTEMTARFSDDEEATGEAAHLRRELIGLADADAEAYTTYLQAPGDLSRERIIEVPEAIAARAREVGELAEQLEREGNRRLVGDAIAARLLAGAAAEGAARLAELNRASPA
jgi:methenyltetrahydrofolate cyclohydrolase